MLFLGAQLAGDRRSASCSACWPGSRPTSSATPSLPTSWAIIGRGLGRVSLNPLRHLDPLGTALLVLIGIGWGSPSRSRSRRCDRVGSAWPMSPAPGRSPTSSVAPDLAAAFRVLDLAGLGRRRRASPAVPAVHVNLLLALLNLIPIPPLDGFAVLTAVVPPRWEYAIRRYQGYGVVLLLILLILPNSPLSAILGLAYPWAAALCGV